MPQREAEVEEGTSSDGVGRGVDGAPTYVIPPMIRANTDRILSLVLRRRRTYEHACKLPFHEEDKGKKMKLYVH